MSAASAVPLGRDAHRGDMAGKGGAQRWAVCFTVMLGVHAGIAAYLLAPRVQPAEGTPQEAIEIDLLPEVAEAAPVPAEVAGVAAPEPQAAPSEVQHAVDPDPPAPEEVDPTKAQAKPPAAPPEAVAPVSPAEAQAELPPEAKPAEHPPEEKATEVAPVVDPAEARAAQERLTIPSHAAAGAAALISGGRRPSAALQATWRSEIGRHLGVRRRYPIEARRRGVQGVAKVHLTIDGEGHVLTSALSQSSGSPVLDGEALALVTRSDPFPKPPPGMPSPASLNVPVIFSIR